MPVSRLLLVALLSAGCTRTFHRPPSRPAGPPAAVPPVPLPIPPSPPPVVADTPGQPDPGATPAGRMEAEGGDRRGERTERPVPPSPPSALHSPPPASDRQAVAALVSAAAARWATVPDFEARLVKREVANNRPVPQSELVYRYRQSPHSVYMKVVAGAGEGREVLYVQGKFGDKLHLVTGKGDHPLVGAGHRTELDPHDKQATAKSRYKVTEAGFGRIIAGLVKQVQAPSGGVSLKPLGAVTRPEYPSPLDGIEAVCPPGVDPTLPKGGTRHIFFDPNPDSPGHRLPVLVVCREPDGREVEYFSFDRFRVPSGWADADWNPGRLKK